MTYASIYQERETTPEQDERFQELQQRFDTRLRQLTDEHETKVARLRGAYGLEVMEIYGDIDTSFRKRIEKDSKRPLKIVT